MCVLLFEYMTCMYDWIISWKGKVVFPLHSVSVLRRRSPKKSHFPLLRYPSGYVWICMDIQFAWSIWCASCQVGFDTSLSLFWCWLCKFDEIQGGGWQLEARKSFGTCQDWGPWPAIIFDYPSRSLTARPWKMMGLEDDPFLLGPGNFSGAMLNC